MAGQHCGCQLNIKEEVEVEVEVEVPKNTSTVMTSGENTHTSIRRQRDAPRLQKCTSCCALYHCPFCLPSYFKPAKPSKLKAHLRSHLSRAIAHEGYTIYRCGLGCRMRQHFHCVYCPSTIVRREDFLPHLATCKSRRTSSVVSVSSSAVRGSSSAVSESSSAFRGSSSAVSVSESTGLSEYASSPTVENEQQKTHTSIRRQRDAPRLQKCTSCCALYHCPFCLPSYFKPAKPSKLKAHLRSHLSRAIAHEGYTIYRCGLGCRMRQHFHCVYCPSTIVRREDFLVHLATCKSRRTSSVVGVSESAGLSEHASSPTTENEQQEISATYIKKINCPVCQIAIRRKNLKKHLHRKHTIYSEGICVDKENGIYTILVDF